MSLLANDRFWLVWCKNQSDEISWRTAQSQFCEEQCQTQLQRVAGLWARRPCQGQTTTRCEPNVIVPDRGSKLTVLFSAGLRDGNLPLAGRLKVLL